MKSRRWTLTRYRGGELSATRREDLATGIVEEIEVMPVSEHEEAVDALRQIAATLGSGAGDCKVNACDGCTYEMWEAADTARRFLGQCAESALDDEPEGG